MLFKETPTQKVNTDFIKTSHVEVFMKRDDLIHPFISGNKWRKLKYNIEKCRDAGARAIVTFGGAYSNHLIATAAACAMASIDCIGVVRGDELSATSNYVLRLCAEFGMDLQFVSRQAYANKSTLQNDFVQQGYYVIPEGGANAEGRKGCHEIVNDYGLYDHVLVAVGTGTTFIGIIEASNEQSCIHGISAVGGGAYLTSEVEQKTNYTNWKLHTEYAFGGFGKFNSDQTDFNKQFAKETGILLDPIYTGKMMRGLYDLIQKGVIEPSQRVLCIHTGGLTGLLSEKWLNS